jgi:hypothetical protein
MKNYIRKSQWLLEKRALEDGIRKRDDELNEALDLIRSLQREIMVLNGRIYEKEGQLATENRNVTLLSNFLEGVTKQTIDGIGLESQVKDW